MAKIQLILQADDLGYSEAVNCGIEKSVRQGLIRAVGVMPNMPAAAHGLRLLQGAGACLGQHTNLCLGEPCADPARIPSLLDGNGHLKSSRAYREARGRGEETTVLEEMVLEIEAQYFRFRALTGQEPAYLDGHAILSRHLQEGLEIVAQKHHLRYNRLVLEGPGDFDGKPINICPMHSMEPDYDPWQSLKNAVAAACTDMPNVFVCHPGYLDDFLLHNSSLTVNRTREVAMLTDPAMRQWLAEHEVELVSYKDL